MELRRPQDLLSLARGEVVTKRNLFDLIQFSKIAGSPYWGGPDVSIGNTPQQGINWIGSPPSVRGVIVKTRPEAYDQDGWTDAAQNVFRYSFKARKSRVSYTELANSVLITQPNFLYPVLVFTEGNGGWKFEGQFAVAEIDETSVFLHRYSVHNDQSHQLEDLVGFQEGGRSYVLHLLAERSSQAVKILKNTDSFSCDICELDFNERYGVEYIEAHHKIPVSSFTSEHLVKPSDLALLCPNCHRAIHCYMKIYAHGYEELKHMMRARLG
ncbi:MAG: restriction endonuclease [Mesorhizobium sp.]|uniref:HNH endonuclease n=1 Tax=Mesorhizobium sp. TaxID=1871066 RepID=UPI0012195238|nr:HNH endonuclease [Mesorhizobium sp.]TIQ33089.1 MAG: restriction endonuclease [Mesorhizobium sp.]